MIINHNLPALNTYNKLVNNNSSMSKSLEKLSSGLRINRAADDAAGLAISEKMRAQIRGLDQASRNSQDGISLIQTAEGALNETHSILQRMRELSVQAANDTYTSQDRSNIQDEIDQLTEEIDRIANTTQFNTKNLLDGSTSAIVSTDNLTTKVFMRDGLRVLDQFGEKAEGGGNYKLEITTTAGTNQVQKTDIFKVKHAATTEGVSVTNTAVTNQKASAEFNVCAACIMTTGASFSLEFDFSDGAIYSINITGAGAAVNGLDIACAINACAALKARLNTSASTATCLSVVDRNTGENFVVTATVAESAVNSNWSFGLVCAALNATCAGSFDTATGSSAAGMGALGAWCAASGISAATIEGSSKAGIACATITAGAVAGACAFVTLGTGLDTSGACTLQGADGCSWNGSLLFEVTNYCAATAEYTYSIKANLYKTCSGQYMYQEATKTVVCGNLCSVDLGGYRMCGITFNASKVGCQAIIQYTGATVAACYADTVCFNLGTCFQFNFANNILDNRTNSFKVFQFGADGGADEITLNLTTGVVATASNATFTLATAETSSGVGSIATLSTKLYDIDKFWDASGNFILEDPQTISLVQGDGSKASITISSSDTLADVKNKLNQAIACGLGQADLTGIGSNTDKFVSYVEKASGDLESVEGTFVIRSAVAGEAGEITFVGDDSVLEALGLSTIQKATSNVFVVDVTDAHTGNVIAQDVKIGDNNLVGVVQKNVDVQFDMSTGVKTTWDATTKNWVSVGGDANKGETFIHLADNTMVFHIGANEKQDIGMGIGDMSADSLGVDNIQVTSNDLANRAMTKIDSAIAKVSAERSKLGALQNRLEHTIANLSTTSENLTASESRIRDVDMAKEMMSFTKYQILSNAATAMLAQANQMPQSVLQLLR